MIAYKGFTSSLTARLGRGTYQFKEGETYIQEEGSKTMRSGFHCCENPYECLSYYHLGNGDRFFQVEAAGNIDEDENERIACTELTLVKELDIKEFALRGMMYMVQHPQRDNWKKSEDGLKVLMDKGEARRAGEIVIARGADPKVKGVRGSILGLIREPEPGNISSAKIFLIGEESSTREGVWYSLSPERKLQEVRDEEERH